MPDKTVCARPNYFKHFVLSFFFSSCSANTVTSLAGQDAGSHGNSEGCSCPLSAVSLGSPSSSCSEWRTSRKQGEISNGKCLNKLTLNNQVVLIIICARDLFFDQHLSCFLSRLFRLRLCLSSSRSFPLRDQCNPGARFLLLWEQLQWSPQALPRLRPCCYRPHLQGITHTFHRPTYTHLAAHAQTSPPLLV